MKNLCLENYGVSKLKDSEAQTIDGGGWWNIARRIILAGAALHDALCDGDCVFTYQGDIGDVNARYIRYKMSGL